MATAKRGKPSGKPSTARRAPVPQAHGGALIPGAGGGPQPGSGRPPSILREQLRGSFAERIATLEQIADGDAVAKLKIGDKVTNTLVSADVGDRLKAIDMLAKYGLGAMKEISVENVRERVSATLDVIREQCPPTQATALIAALRPIWA